MSRPTLADVILTAALDIVAEHGLERATVREVAGRAGVSIGAVQHHYGTKDDLIAAAYTEVVRRIRQRVGAIEYGERPRANLAAALRELLPLDLRREREVRIQLAFAVRAAADGRLARIQADVLAQVQAELAAVFATLWPAEPDRCSRSAVAVLAVADGLALHAVTSGGRPDVRTLTAALDLVLDAVTGGSDDR